MMFGKPWEFWIALIGAAIYTATRDAEKAPVKQRLTKTLSSAALAYALADELAPFTRNSESLAAVIIMVVGLFILDVMTALVSDRAFIMSLIKSKIGGGKGNGQP